MPDIVLTTLNAKFIHCAFGLRYLLANLGALRPRACLREFDINQRPVGIAERLLAENPRIIGFGVYIWNAAPTAEVVRIIKCLRPSVTVILGGPEVSYEPETNPLVPLADHVISGEADRKFAAVCAQLLEGGEAPPRFIPAELPQLDRLAFPYDDYTDQDIAHRIIYLEASRGCPFSCEFCLSSLDIPVRQFPLEPFLEQLSRLIGRGVRHFKFVDRTFNLNLEVSRRILEFLLGRHTPGNLYHFEMVPDRLPVGLREVIARFPPGALQFEIGIQTFLPLAAELIHRRQNYTRLEENLRFLRAHTHVHLHADLIVGLPGEDLANFALGFNRLVALEPQEIQVGILKRLRGAPIARHDAEWGMIYNPAPPYELLENRLLDFFTLQKLRRFARHWDLVANSGNFVETSRLLYRSSGPPGDSAFDRFSEWSEWLHAQVGKTDSIALVRLMELCFRFLTGVRGVDPHLAAGVLWRDYQRGGRSDKPVFLKDYLRETPPSAPRSLRRTVKRQARHAAKPAGS